MLKNCKSAQTKAQYYGIQKTTSERSEWFHKNKFDIMMAWMTPVSLHFSDVPTGSNNLNRQTTLGYWFRAFATNNFSRRTVVQINLWTQWMIPQKQVRYHDGMDDTVSLHFSDVPTGSNNLYRQTTLGYWFSTFATNSLSRRTVVQINLRPPHSVPCATWPANLPAATRPPRHRGDCAKGARQVFSQAATGRHPLQSSCNPRRAKHIKPQRFDWCLQSNGRARAWIRPWSLPAWTVSRVGHKQFSTVPNKNLHTNAFTHGAFTQTHFDTQTLWHTKAFTHKRFYTQTLLHTDAFTHRRFYTQKLLHTDGFTHRRFYTQTLLHADAFYTRTHAFTHKRFYTQTRWHTNAFTHRRFYAQMRFTHAHALSHTNAFTHRRVHTQTLLHTDAFTHRRFYTQTLLHADAFYTRRHAFTHKRFYTQTPLHTDTFTQTKASIAIFPQFLTSKVHFVQRVTIN